MVGPRGHGGMIILDECEMALKTPLHDIHVALGARMVDFAGWTLPLQFAGIREEHVHTRTSCSVFDVSHMGRLKLTGNDCATMLDHLTPRNLGAVEIGRSYYSHICREDGGVLDDVIVSRFETHWGIVCNGVNREKIVSWLTEHARGTDVQITDETLGTAMIAIQGPKTLELASELANIDFASIKRYHHRALDVMGMPIVVFRSGYTGEDGFEIAFPALIAGMLMPRLLGTKASPHPTIRPAGLGARDTLRIEAGMPLYGHELSEDWDSLTAGQGWCVDLSTDFIGADALRRVKESGPARRLVGLELEGRRIARQHFPVLANGGPIGEITSGTLGPTLGKSIAMALISSELAEVGSEVAVEIGGRAVRADVVKLPFYKRPS